MKDDLDGVSVKIWDCGIVQGCQNGCSGANDFLNRREMAAVLVNAENWIKRNYFEWEGLK